MKEKNLNKWVEKHNECRSFHTRHTEWSDEFRKCRERPSQSPHVNPNEHPSQDSERHRHQHQMRECLLKECCSSLQWTSDNLWCMYDLWLKLFWWLVLWGLDFWMCCSCLGQAPAFTEYNFWPVDKLEWIWFIPSFLCNLVLISSISQGSWSITSMLLKRYHSTLIGEWFN